MRKFFSPKALVFYGGSVLAVIILFSIATSYGETNLQAPRQIDGRYLLQIQNLPGCLQAKQLVLQIHQSGQYLTGALLPSDATEKMIRIGEERPSLSGQWHQPRLILEGGSPSLPDCRDAVSIQGEITQQPVSGTVIYGNTIISGTVAPGQGSTPQDILTGALRLGQADPAVPFTAKREAFPSKTPEH